MRKEQKGLVCLAFVIAILFSLLPIGVAAEDSFTYVLTDQGAIITDYHYTDSAGKDVVIPKEIEGKKVIGIGDNAFSGMNITSVDFTQNYNNLQFIGSGAFFDCDELSAIEIPTSVTMINNDDSSIPYVGAFENCAKLTMVEIPQSVTDMGVDVFKDSPNVKIYGVAKSYAEDYAVEYELPFFAIELPVVEKLEIDKASGINIGNTINLKATVNGGTAPYTFKFYFERDGEEGLVTDFQAASAVNFDLTKAGNYTFYAVVKDANNKTYTKAYKDYLVINEPVVSLVADKASNQYVNTDITLTATVAAQTGTAPFIYNFYYQLGEEIEVIEENSGDNQAVFRLAEGGNYTLFVDVEDAEGLVRRAEIKDFVIVDDLSVGSFTVTPQKEDTKRPEINSVVKLEALGAGGKTGYQYRFYYQFAEKTFDIQGYSSINTAEFKPSVAGSYTLYVDVKNGSGKVSTQMIEAYTVVDTPVINSFTTNLPSGQSVNTPITLTADVSGGTEPYQYSFFYQLGSGKKTPIQEEEANKNDNQIIFTPAEKGTYKLYVEVKDADSNSSVVTKMISGYKIIPELVVKSLSANKASGQNINTAVKLTATGTGGKTPYEYEFSYQLGANLPVVFREYSKTKSADFVPLDAGDYKLTVTIKDANGATAEKSIDVFKVLNNPVITAFKTNLPTGQYVDTEIGLFAESSGGTGAKTYSFTAKNGSKDASDAITQTGSSEAVFKPTQPGTYTLSVMVNDDSSGVATKTITNYKVIAGVSVTSFSAKIGKEVNIGDKIPLTASATGGKSSYQYRFYYKLDGGTEVSIRDYSKTKTADFIPTEPGNYKLYVQAKDANGVESPEKSLSTAAVDVLVANNPAITSFVVDRPTGQYAGEEIKLTAQVAGGTAPYTYDFYYKLGTSGTPVLIDSKDIPDKNCTTAFSIPDAGLYTLYVEVKDVTEAKIVSKSILKYNVMAKPTAASLKASKASPQNLDTALRLTATATGGKAPYQFEFSYQLGADAPVVFKPFATAKTAEFKPLLPGQAGTYKFFVRVKDANGIIGDAKQLDKGDFIITDDPVITGFKAGLPSGQYINTAIPLTVEATGGTSVTYHFYYKLGSDAPVDIELASPDKATTFTPPTAGIYTLFVDAVDSAPGGKTVTKTITNYKVIDYLGGSLTLNKTVDENIKLTATATGGKTPYRYKFYYTKDGDPAEVLIRNYSTTRTASFAPDAPGNYEVYLEITDNDKGTAPFVTSETLTVN